MKPFQHDPGLVSPLEVDAEVRDRKRPAPANTGTVVDVLGATADEFVVDAIDCTVAEDNPAYPPDDPVVVVVWDADERETPYHFPQSRLVSDPEIEDVPPRGLVASPSHDRSFDAAANPHYIDRVSRLGFIESLLTVRETGAGLELVDGHKRRWIATEAGLETVAVWVVEVDNATAAALYDACHRATGPRASATTSSLD